MQTTSQSADYRYPALLFPRADGSVMFDEQKKYTNDWGLCNQLISLIIHMALALVDAERERRVIGIAVDCLSCGVDTGAVVSSTRLIDFAETNRRLRAIEANIEIAPRESVRFCTGVKQDPGADGENTNVGEEGEVERAFWSCAKPLFVWYIYCEDPFMTLLNCITFHPTLHAAARDVAAQISGGHECSHDVCSHDVCSHEFSNFHAIHLRTEMDGLVNWARNNKMAVSDFRTVLIAKYNSLIAEHVPRGEAVLLLTDDAAAEVVSFLKDDNRNNTIVQYDKGAALQRIGFPDGREARGLLDLLLCSAHSGLQLRTVIGCQSPQTGWGSSFSLLLRLFAPALAKKVMFDLEYIDAPACAYFDAASEIVRAYRQRVVQLPN